ncbi:uncharacterized protein UV8b_03518 [Ustilaginoidea virens]|nr:uncharacterized protein UV8b_03518 [Ustilaginoidea virens]QUC19277.1 hypothetical protein UV8b_03518 [Ustilaginoidea virens]
MTAASDATSSSASMQLPPSPTGSGLCRLHGDHWHCHASSTAAVDTVTASGAGSCQPHDDHWHCPSGVSQPATPPAQTQPGASPTTGDDEHDHHGPGKECTPEGDHWHCPTGLSAPTDPPTPVASTTAARPSISGITAAASATASKAQGNSRPSFFGYAGAAVAASVGAFLLGTVTT